jgi:anthranilate/para-aminobenzoate synthase component II
VQAINNLMEAYLVNKKLRIVGVCFGHQIISHYFKAKLVKKERKGGLETVNFDEKLI